MSNNKKEEIIKAATRLFCEKGFSSTSVQDIVNEVNISKGTLYYYFTSKQQILFEVISRGMQLMLPFVKEIYNSPLSPKDKLRKIIKTHLKWLLENIDMISVGLHDRDRLIPEYRKKYMKQRDEYQKIIERIIKEGIKQKQFPALNVKLITYAIFDICNGPSRWYKPQGPLTPEQLGEEYANLICDYMLDQSK